MDRLGKLTLDPVAIGIILTTGDANRLSINKSTSSTGWPQVTLLFYVESPGTITTPDSR